VKNAKKNNNNNKEERQKPKGKERIIPDPKEIDNSDSYSIMMTLQNRQEISICV